MVCLTHHSTPRQLWALLLAGVAAVAALSGDSSSSAAAHPSNPQQQASLLQQQLFTHSVPGGFVVPLSSRAELLEEAHSSTRRHLLNHGATSPILGSVLKGYFYAQLLLGTPPTAYSTIIDTGSSMTYIPCSNCQHCGKHTATPFDPSKSSTARWLSCSDKKCQCGVPACSCKVQGQLGFKQQQADKDGGVCYYKRHYAEESSSEGWLVADQLHLAAPVSSTNSSSTGSSSSSDTTSSSSTSSGRTVEVVFGCEDVETGEIYNQVADGVLGMGNNENSLPRQLARAGVVEDMFSLCYGFPQGGSMYLGDVPLEPKPQLSWTPFVSTPLHYYTIATQSISLGGKKLAVNPVDFTRGYGTVLDSGTTFTYLPSPAFKAFLAALDQALAPHMAAPGSKLRRVKPLNQEYNDICWTGAPEKWEDLSDIFPSGNITFAGGAHIELVPYRYLFKFHQQYCLGMFDNGYQGALLGGIITRNVLVQYDKTNNRAGFFHTDCHALKPAAQAREISEESQSSSSSSSQQKQQPQQPSAFTPAGDDAASSSSIQDANQQQHHEAAAAGGGGSDGWPSAGPHSSGSRGGWQQAFSSSHKLVWLGIAVSAVLVVGIALLAAATLWQPPPCRVGVGAGEGRSGGGLLPGAFSGGIAARYQQVAMSDVDQELGVIPPERSRAPAAVTAVAAAPPAARFVLEEEQQHQQHHPEAPSSSSRAGGLAAPQQPLPRPPPPPSSSSGPPGT